MKQRVSAVVESTIAVDKHEVRKALETLSVRVTNVRVDKVEELR